MRLFLGLLLLFLLPGSIIGFRDGVVMIANNPDLLYPLLAGAVAGIIIYRLFIRRNYALLTFEHELTHAVMGLLFFRKITEFISTRSRGGYVRHTSGFGGEFGDTMISMAPYFFPTFTVLTALLRPVIPAAGFPWFDGLIGFTIAFHFLSTFSEIRQNWSSKQFTLAGTNVLTQTDLARTGFLLAFLFIVTLTLFFHGMVFGMLSEGYSGFVPFVSNVFQTSFGFSVSAVAWLGPQIRRFTG